MLSGVKYVIKSLYSLYKLEDTVGPEKKRKKKRFKEYINYRITGGIAAD